jgi:hypothetical protein
LDVSRLVKASNLGESLQGPFELGLRNIPDNDVPVPSNVLYRLCRHCYKVVVFDDEEGGCVGVELDIAGGLVVMKWFSIDVVGLDEFVNPAEHLVFISCLQVDRKGV